MTCDVHNILETVVAVLSGHWFKWPIRKTCRDKYEENKCATGKPVVLVELYYGREGREHTADL